MPDGLRVKFLRKALIPQTEDHVKKFQNTCEILIAEPSKLQKLLQKVKLPSLEHLVVDEGDRMMEAGLLDNLKPLFLQKNLSKYFFSATFQPGVESMVKELLNKPCKVCIGVQNSTNPNIEQKIIYCGREDGKLHTIKQFIRDGFKPPMLLFM